MSGIRNLSIPRIPEASGILPLVVTCSAVSLRVSKVCHSFGTRFFLGSSDRGHYRTERKNGPYQRRTNRLHPHALSYSKKRVHAALHEIRKEPASGKQLQDELEGYRSFRVGKLKIIYRRTVRKEIEIIAVGPRRTIYEEAALLIIKEKER